jgi:hypothetical protein
MGGLATSHRLRGSINDPACSLLRFQKKLAKGMYNTQTGVVYVILILAYRWMYRQLIQSIDREAFCKLFSVLHCA